MVYQNWSPGQPGDDSLEPYLYMDTGDNYQWHDVNEYTKSFICEV